MFNIASRASRTSLIDVFKKEAKRLLKLAHHSGGRIQIENLSQAQEVISRLKGAKSWFDFASKQKGDEGPGSQFAFMLGRDSRGAPVSMHASQVMLNTLIIDERRSLYLDEFLAGIAGESIREGGGGVWVTRHADSALRAVHQAAALYGRSDSVIYFDFTGLSVPTGIMGQCLHLLDIRFDDHIARRNIVVVGLPMTPPDHSSVIGRFVLTRLTEAFTRLTPDPCPYPFICLLDDYLEYANDSFHLLPARARANHIAWMAVCNGYGVPSDQRELAKFLLANAGNQKELMASLLGNAASRIVIKDGGCAAYLWGVDEDRVAVSFHV